MINIVDALKIEADHLHRSGPSGDVRLAEADHRIANNLAMIIALLRVESRRLARGEGPIPRYDVRALLDDIAMRIQTVARLHHLLARAEQTHHFDLGSYLPEVCQSVTDSLAGQGGVRLGCEIADGCTVAPDAAVSLGLIICELVTNSVKYAHPTGLAVEIMIDCRWDPEDGLVLEYADDGVGLPEDFDPETDGGIGLMLVRDCAKKLHAGYAFRSGPLGLGFQLSMPPRLVPSFRSS